MSETFQNAHDENFWQAFLYVSGEMAEAESAVFEQRLLEDERLCDAVSEAVRLTAAVAEQSVVNRHIAPEIVRPAAVVSLQAAASQRRGSQAPVSSHSGIAALAALAMCLCVMWAISGFEVRDAGEAVAMETSDSDAEWIVSVWAEESAMESAGLDEPDGDLDEDLDVPDWLVTAVSLSDTEADFMESDDMDL